MTRPLLDLISLADLARDLGTNYQRLLRRLRTHNDQVGGMALMQAPKKPGSRKGGDIFVNKAVLLGLGLDASGIGERVSELEGHTKSLDARLSDIEAKVA